MTVKRILGRRRRRRVGLVRKRVEAPKEVTEKTVPAVCKAGKEVKTRTSLAACKRWNAEKCGGCDVK